MSTLITWKCAIIGCGKPRWVHNVVNKRTKDQQNTNVVAQTSNQTPMVGSTQVWRDVCIVFKGTSTKNVANFCLCRWSIKEACKWEYNCITRLSKGGPKDGHGVVKFKYLKMPTKREKHWFQHVLSHKKEWGDHPIKNKW